MTKRRKKYERTQVVYVLEVGGTPVVAFAAHSSPEASSLRREPWLYDDLRAARVNGHPVWDGMATLTVRQASAAEAETYSETANVTVDGSGELLLVYLIEVD